jgi:serine acetyltransferase
MTLTAPTPPSDRGLRSVLATDYSRLYDGRGESPAELRSRAPSRFASNPSLHAVFMIRRALEASPRAFGIWRQALLAKHSIDLEPGCEIGPGLLLPHPFGLMLAAGTRIGSDVTLYHNTTYGEAGEETGNAPVLGDGVIVHTNSVVAAGAVLGRGAIVGANSHVTGEVPDRAVVRQGKVVTRD